MFSSNKDFRFNKIKGGSIDKSLRKFNNNINNTPDPQKYSVQINQIKKRPPSYKNCILLIIDYFLSVKWMKKIQKHKSWKQKCSNISQTKRMREIIKYQKYSKKL